LFSSCFLKHLNLLAREGQVKPARRKNGLFSARPRFLKPRQPRRWFQERQRGSLEQGKTTCQISPWLAPHLTSRADRPRNSSLQTTSPSVILHSQIRATEWESPRRLAGRAGYGDFFKKNKLRTFSGGEKMVKIPHFFTHCACFSRSAMAFADLNFKGKREAAMGEKVRSTFSEPGSPSHLQLCPGSKKFLPSSLP
jgi:hypothetical protein